MSDMVKGFTVVLKKDMREEDAEQIMQAIKLMKGVADVKPEITQGGDILHQMRAKSEVKDKLIKFIEENFE